MKKLGCRERARNFRILSYHLRISPRFLFLVSIMASLNARLVASTGRLPPVEQAKPWALREVLRKRGDDVLQYAWMAGQVKLVGGGHPTRQAMKKCFDRVDTDKELYPGRRWPGQGRPLQLTKQTRTIVARSAMALKRRKLEPNYANVVAQCPVASANLAQGVPSPGTSSMRSLRLDPPPLKF